MNQPLISIIITVLNGANTIEACLASLAGQSFKNFNVVLIDGGSVDQTLSIIDRSPLANKVVRIIPGIGLYAGLNAGVKLAAGKWFYFMGCDDELYSVDTLQEVANIIQSSAFRHKVLVGNVYYKQSGSVYRSKFGSPFLMGYQVHHQGMFYDRHIFDSLTYNETMRTAADYELNLKLVRSRTPHYFTDLIIGTFNQHGISHTQLELGAKEMQDAHKRVFSGFGRLWLVNYFTIRHRVGSFRERYHLGDLKGKFRRFLNLAQ